MPTQRGIVTTGGGRSEVAESLVDRAFANRPVKPMAQEDAPEDRPADERDPLKGAARFTVHGYKTYNIKIHPLPEGDYEDDERTKALLRSIKTDYLNFHEGALITHNPEVQAWLRGRLENGLLPDISEDDDMRDLDCPVCHQYIGKNDRHGARKIAAHMKQCPGPVGPVSENEPPLPDTRIGPTAPMGPDGPVDHDFAPEHPEGNAEVSGSKTESKTPHQSDRDTPSKPPAARQARTLGKDK